MQIMLSTPLSIRRGGGGEAVVGLGIGFFSFQRDKRYNIEMFIACLIKNAYICRKIY